MPTLQSTTLCACTLRCTKMSKNMVMVVSARMGLSQTCGDRRSPESFRETFRDFQRREENGDFQRLSETFRDFQKLSENFGDLQRASETLKSRCRHSVRFPHIRTYWHAAGDSVQGFAYTCALQCGQWREVQVESTWFRYNCRMGCLCRCPRL